MKPQSKKKLHSDNPQSKPGLEYKMLESPDFEPRVEATGQKLLGRVALISGGDSGIGRAVAIAFARHGANVAICYLPEEAKDARLTSDFIALENQECLLFPGDISKEAHCTSVIERTVKHFGRLDILVNNAGTHTSKDSLLDITAKQLKRTFETNLFPMFYLSREALKHMKAGAVILNTASVTAYRGSDHLIDYAASKGAIVAFTRSLAASLAKKKIRVNAVAPGPIWTPLIVSGLTKKEIPSFGSITPMGRAGQPWEVASCFTFLASDEASFMTGQVLHPNGGEIVNS